MKNKCTIPNHLESNKTLESNKKINVKKILLFFTLISCQFVFTKNNDTIKNSFNLFLNQRSIYAVELSEPYLSPIKNNNITSVTVNYDFNVLSKKSYKIRGNIGLNINSINIGYKSSSNLLDQNISNFTTNFIEYNIQNSIYMEKNIFKIKKSKLNFSIGIISNGSLFGSIKNEKSFVFKNSFDKFDEIKIIKKQNNLYKLSPFIQLKMNSSLNNLYFNYGTRLILGSEIYENMNYEYKIIQDRQFYNSRSGQFKDNINAWEFFLGICL